MAGVKMLAEAIDSIVMRVQVQLTNLTLRSAVTYHNIFSTENVSEPSP